MQVTFSHSLKEKLVDHLEKFKEEAKRLNVQLNCFKREFTQKDNTFLKLRNVCTAQEFTLMQLKRYFNEQNIRMAYKVLGMSLP